ncbi:hypothetical protein ACQCN2_13360 [Brevibacillus ginsengisoli]|uniref:hypothetical protein n=1 Tax=Brevibacillus ginsengisoli TaxID=363854 RepID=UPI003CFB9114
MDFILREIEERAKEAERKVVKEAKYKIGDKLYSKGTRPVVITDIHNGFSGFSYSIEYDNNGRRMQTRALESSLSIEPYEPEEKPVVDLEAKAQMQIEKIRMEAEEQIIRIQLINRLVEVIDENSDFYKEFGYVTSKEGTDYFVEFLTSNNTRVFKRDQITLPHRKKFGENNYPAWKDAMED